MNALSSSVLSRREFLKHSGQVAAVSALAGVALPHVHAAGSDLIKVALVGCGGRGTGAAGQAISTTSGPIKLVAMADVFPAKLKSSLDRLTKQYAQQADKIEVPAERQFIGFDGYKAAMDCLKPGDVVILATPPAFRWVMFQHAIAKGLHVFMEKPLSVDGPTTRRMIALGDKAKEQNLKVGVGLMVRHCEGRKELYQRIRHGEIGDIVSMRAYRMGSGGGTAPPKPEGISELMYQISKFHAFSVAKWRCFLRLLYSPDRRVLVDERCLAGGGDGDGRAALSGRFARSEFRHLFRPIYLSRRGQTFLRRAQYARGAQ